MAQLKKTHLASRRLRIFVAAATAALQLHLFFVTDLHNHNIKQSAAGEHSKTSLRPAQTQNLPAPDPICSACRISHQGVVHLSAVAPLKSRDYMAGRVRATRILKFAQRFPSGLSSRAPPLS